MRTVGKNIVLTDKQHVWHPFTQMSDWLKEDIVVIEKGKGCYLIDADGNEYIDGVSSLWTNVHGHCKKEIDDAIKAQLDSVAHSTFLGLTNIPATLLAEELVAIAPHGLRKVFYADSGSEAVEIGLKVAYQYWCQKDNPQPQRNKFVHLSHSYHGDTIGSVSVGGIDLFHKIYRPFLFETLQAPAPYCYRCECGQNKESCAMECINVLEDVLASHSNEIAAIVIEPGMQGAAGMINQPKGYLKSVKTLAEKYNTLLLCDEVATGFGRTGKMFACEQEGVLPDILALGKGITGGYLPLSATLFTEEIFNAFLGLYSECKTFYHGHTYTGNQLAAQAALASLKLFKTENILERMRSNIDFMKTRLQEYYSLSHVGDIRQCGFMVGIELVKNKEKKTLYAMDEKIGIRVINEARKRGVLIRPLGNIIVLMPPLSIEQETLKTLMDVVFASIKNVTEQ